MHGFVGVHIGAGRHSEARTNQYFDVCSAACLAGVEVLRKGGSAVEAAAAATVVLEDAAETNAGFGSNLTESGTVEMDAGLMDGESLIFGAVGAVSGIKNPVTIAKMLVDEQRQGLLPLGRVPPGFLVGDGARQWAMRRGVSSVVADSLVSDKARKLYKHYKRKLDALPAQVAAGQAAAAAAGEDASLQGPSEKRLRSSAASLTESSDSSQADVDGAADEDDQVQDTVGAVAVDALGRVASSVSSGGIALKQPGRVGQAACFGCGCWAQNVKAGQTEVHQAGNAEEEADTPGQFSVGVSTTGCGEHLVRTLLARECATELSKSRHPLWTLRGTMKQKFVQSEFLSGLPEKLGGAICVHMDPHKGEGHFLWTHTTSSMGLAFMTTADQKATTVMSRLPAKALSSPAPGTSILVQCVPFALNAATHLNGCSSANPELSD